MLVIVLLAAVSDVKTRRVSNRLILISLMICIAIALGSFQIQKITEVVINLSIPVILLYPLYLIGVIGAGDIKLLSIMSGFTNYIYTLEILVLAFLAGAVWSLILLIAKKSLIKNMKSGFCYLLAIAQGKYVAYDVFKCDREQITIPFAVCVAAVYIIRWIGNMNV